MEFRSEAPSLSRLFAIGLVITAGALGQGPVCTPDWLPSNFATTADGMVLCSVVFDDGFGPKLYVGGSFTTTGGAPSTGIAAWDGTTWSSVGGGVTGSVNALAVWDDGTGPGLFVGGWFSGPGNNIAKWTGSQWLSLSVGVNTGVQGLAVYDDGTGPQLYLGGWFVSSGATPLNHIARWNGTTFSQVGTGLSSGMNSCAVFNNVLYVGGSFTTAGGVASPRLAAYNGAWSAIGTGANGDINAMHIFDDGTGAALYIGGLFQNVASVPAVRVARYDGVTWSALGTGLASICFGLGSYDDGSGPALYATGAFTTAGGNPCNRIAKWDGANWSALGNGLGDFTGRTLCVYPSLYGPSLFVGGGFTTVGNALNVPNLAVFGPSPPIVMVPPASQAVNAGSPVTFSVTVAGSNPTYQWQHSGFPIPGATSASFTINAVNPFDWGPYDCAITNGCGTTLSPAGVLTLNPAFNLTMNQPFGPLSLFMNHQSPGQGGASYITTFSFDPANGAMPGQGGWGGLFVPFAEVINQVLFGTPPFLGTLDGSGQAFLFIPAGTLPPVLIGQTVYTVSMTVNLMTLQLINNSNIASTTIF